MGFLTNIIGAGLAAGASILPVDKGFSASDGSSVVGHDPNDPNYYPNTDNGEDKTNFGDEMKLWKFNKMVEDITMTIEDSLIKPGDTYYPEELYCLGMVYNHRDINDYGKKIMLQKYVDINLMDSVCEYWDVKKSVMEKLIEKCNSDDGKRIASRFLFWALMILIVDDTKQGEHLSLICDFAQVLGISNEEMLDIVNVIAIVYDKAEDSIEFHSNLILKVFNLLLKKHGYMPKGMTEKGISIWMKNS